MGQDRSAYHQEDEESQVKVHETLHISCGQSQNLLILEGVETSIPTWEEVEGSIREKYIQNGSAGPESPEPLIPSQAEEPISGYHTFWASGYGLPCKSYRI